MSGEAPNEYDLVDPDPESTGETPTPTPNRSGVPGQPGQPLPRMWKSEPDEPPSTPPPPAAKPRETPPPTRRRAKAEDEGGPTRRTGLKPKPDLNEKGEKKVLVEDTPVLDTYETRQRVRLATGGLVLFVVGLGCYLFYQMFLYDPFPIGDLPPDEAAVDSPPPPPKVDLEFEARAMMARAREAARGGRTDEAIALLEQLAKSYRGTRSATEAQEALKRPSKNLPLFLEGPTVAAAAPPPAAPEPPAEPPAVVDVRPPTVEPRASVSLVPPVNPQEAAIAPPSARVGSIAASPGGVPDRRLPAGFSAKAEAGFDPSGWPLVIVGDRDGAPMVFVPGGVFTMGDARDSQFAAPEHKVRLSSYYIDQHEVTVGQYRRFLSETRYKGRPETVWPPVDDKDPSADSLPMTMVNQADAIAFAEWAGKALPTEAQWEAAARTTDARTYPWGDEPANPARKRAPRQVGRIMAFPEDKSPYEVFDLAGNALEWTADAFDRNYYRSLVAQVAEDPPGASPPRTGRYDVVVKGGKLGAGASREPIAPEKRLNYVGFRCALQVERPAVPAAPQTPPAATVNPEPRRPAPKATAPVEPF